MSDRKNKFGGGGPRPDLRQWRQQQADLRRLDRSKRSALQQLQELDERLGINVGAERERARLVAQSIAEVTVTPVKANKKGKKA